MHRKIPSIVELLSCFALLAISHLAIAQQSDSIVSQPTPDTPVSEFMKQVREIGEKETRASITKFEKGRIEARQRKILESVRHEIQLAGLFLKQFVDTISILQDLSSSKVSYEIVSDGVFKNQGTHHTQRNLFVSDAILEETSFRLETHRKKLDTYYQTLSGYRYRIDSLSSDSIIYQFPKDSTEVVKYFKTVLSILKEVSPIDSSITMAVSSTQRLLQEIDFFLMQVHSARNEIEKLNTNLSQQLGNREFPNLWENPKNKRPIAEILSISKQKEVLALGFYLKGNAGKLTLLLLFIFISSFFIYSLKQHLINENSINEKHEGQLVIRYPVLSAIIISTSVFQFMFQDPPFIFSFMLWLAAAIFLGVLFNRHITPFWMRFWIIMVAAFTLAGLSNLILQASRIERWGMLALQVFGIIYGIYILQNKQKANLRERKILYFIGIFTIIELLAAGFNAFGRYNLSKTFMIIGYSGLIIAILFLWTVRLLNEGLVIASQIYQHPDKKLFYINFEKVGNKVPVLFYIFLIVGWLILMGRHLFVFRQWAGPFNHFLTAARTIGDYSFSINGILIFVLILFSSLFLSRLISFFAAEPDATNPHQQKIGRVPVGSWLLLIRIIIISSGLFLAIAAAGIPLDRITLIIGALGVGIGLGLQGLVNNLVSGLIIAFEKPVNVGDIIEVDGKSGTMKSIGFRSSVVVTSDGSSLIIPNGDLLSQHLVNWTMSKNRKRINLVIGVAYGTNIAQAKEVISVILQADTRISNIPPPAVLARDFAPSSIELEVFFWLSDLRMAGEVKSQVIQQIQEQFEAAGIQIPIPQQEILLKTPSTHSPDNKTK
jgi:small-conductance mechanosensitive channel